MNQVQLPIDWMADPRRRNNTWDPWLRPGAFLYAYASATSTFCNFSVILHVGLVLFIAALKTVL